jgi:hypothetical protein
MYADKLGYHPELPNKIREIFMSLCQDVAVLKLKWDFYWELFGNTENANLLHPGQPHTCD